MTKRAKKLLKSYKMTSFCNFLLEDAGLEIYGEASAFAAKVSRSNVQILLTIIGECGKINIEYVRRWTVRSLKGEVITMVTYEGLFLFVTMLTAVIALIFNIIKFFRNK